MVKKLNQIAMYEVIKNNRPTGILIEAKTAMEAGIIYSHFPQDKSQYNTCITITFKKVTN